VEDPTLAPLDFLVVEQESGWVAYNQSGAAIAPGTSARGIAFLLIGPPQSLLDRIEQSPPFQGTAFTFTQKLAGADHVLATQSVVGEPRNTLCSIPSFWLRIRPTTM
jgi:hypothetical protein